MKVAVFADVGGHGTQFFNSLKNLGVDVETGHVPDGLQIV